MRKKLLSMLLSGAMVVTLFTGTIVHAASQTDSGSEPLGVNLALKARASAGYGSYNNGWKFMNDGKLATANPATSWNSWGDTVYPVTARLNWDQEYTLTGMRVIWWADMAALDAEGGVSFPKSCKVRYIDAEGRPQVITGMTDESGNKVDQVGVKFDSSSNSGINGNNKYWNYVKFPQEIKTRELQLVIERNGTGTNGVGISEWEVFGEEKANEFTGIKIIPPAKTEYKQGEALDLDGMKVTAQYSDGSEKQITADQCKVEGYDPEKDGEQTITVTYEGKSATFKVTVVKRDDPRKPIYEIFTDVSKDAWYVDNVQYVYDKGIMLGMTDTFFGTDTTLKRSHFATMLYRMEGKPKAEYTDRFHDVPKGAFYADAVLWASSEDVGVIAGYENGKFGPDDIITREQMAVMLYRYAEYKKYDKKAANDLKGFTDSGKVSPFATDAMKWAVGSELIKGEGDGKQLNPQGETSRGVCAAIMQRFLSPYDK